METVELERATQEEVEAVSKAAKLGKEVLGQFVDTITYGKQPEREVVERLDRIIACFQDLDDEDKEPGTEDALQYIEDLRAYLSVPTEYVGSQLRVMSDKTRMNMANGLLKTMSMVGWKELSKQGMVPAVAVYRFIRDVVEVTKTVAVSEYGDNSKPFLRRWEDKMKDKIFNLRASGTTDV